MTITGETMAWQTADLLLVFKVGISKPTPLRAPACHRHSVHRVRMIRGACLASRTFRRPAFTVVAFASASVSSSGPGRGRKHQKMDIPRLTTRLNEILQSSDLEKITENSIRKRLAEEFGTPMEPYKQLIKDIINQYLESIMEEEGDAEAEEAPLPRQASVSAVVKSEASAGSKRKAGTDQDTQSSKAARPLESGDFVVELSANKRATVSVFKGAVRVDLREFYKDRESGEIKPGPKGLSLQPEQWQILRQHLPALLNAVTEGREAQPVALAPLRQAYINLYNNKYVLHVREMYEKDGELKPGKHGVCLDAAAVGILADAAADITAAAEHRGASQAVGAGPSKPAAKAEPMQENVAPADASTSGVAPGMVDLGGNKFASVTVFKDKMYVDLREYYERDGKKLPGKKGIMLLPEQFSAIVQNEPAISKALSAQSTTFELLLSDKRKVTISSFKGKCYVNVREYYSDDGQLKPGQKGMSMTMDSWHKLVDQFSVLQSQLK